MFNWMPIIVPVAAAVFFAFLSIWMEQSQNKEKVNSKNKPQPAGQKKTV